jgi:hypothetical protein
MRILGGLRHECPSSNMCFPEQFHTIDRLPSSFSELMLSL